MPKTDDDWIAFFSLAMHYQRLWQKDILTIDEAAFQIGHRHVQSLALKNKS